MSDAGEPPRAAAEEADTPASPALSPAPAATRRPGELLTLAAMLTGTALTLVSLHAPLVLLTGLALGLGGALLALRGDRPLPAPRALFAAFALVIVASVGAALVGVYQDWTAGMELASGASMPVMVAHARTLAGEATVLRVVALAAALTLPLAGVVTRLATPPRGR